MKYFAITVLFILAGQVRGQGFNRTFRSFHIGYSYMGTSVAYAGPSIYTEFESKSNRKYYAICSDIGIGFYSTERFPGYIKIMQSETNFLFAKQKWYSLALPCLSVQTIVSISGNYGYTVIPKIGTSIFGIIDLKYGYSLINSGPFKTMQKHTIGVTFRPYLLFQMVEKMDWK